MESETPLISNACTENAGKLSIKLQLSYGVGHVLNDVCASMWYTYLIVYFRYVLEFTDWQSGFVLLVGQVADAIATPFVGFHSDQNDDFCWSRYGKRKIWHLFGSICILVTFPFIFSPCINCEGSHKWAQLFYYCVFIIVFQFGWAAVQISHLSLIPDLTPNEHARTKLTAVRYGFTVLSNVMVYVITWCVLRIGANENDSQIGPSDSSKFQTVVWSGLSVGVVATLIFHAFVKESDSSANDGLEVGHLKSSVGSLLTSTKVYQVAVIYMSTRLFANLTQVFVPLYLHETLNMPTSSLAVVPLIMFMGSFVTSFLTETLNRNLGRRTAYIFGSLLGVISCIWIQVRSGPDFIAYDIYGVAASIGACSSILLVTSLGITADLIGDTTDSGAFIYGIMSFFDKLSNGIAVIIIQDYKGQQSTYYRDIISYVCGGAVIIGSLAVLSVMKRIRENRNGYEVIPSSNNTNSAIVST